jgi:hypothetical protein
MAAAEVGEKSLSESDDMSEVNNIFESGGVGGVRMRVGTKE